jgi:hypothetical protein
MVCFGCGKTNWPRCDKCDELTLFRADAPEYSHPRGYQLIHDAASPPVPIIEGNLGDGTDFFGSSFVSNRAKNWMEETKTFPVELKPALLNIEGVEDRFSAALIPHAVEFSCHSGNPVW